MPTLFLYLFDAASVLVFEPFSTRNDVISFTLYLILIQCSTMVEVIFILNHTNADGFSFHLLFISGCFCPVVAVHQSFYFCYWSYKYIIFSIDSSLKSESESWCAATRGGSHVLARGITATKIFYDIMSSFCSFFQFPHLYVALYKVTFIGFDDWDL